MSTSILASLNTISDAPARMTLIDEATGLPFRNAETGETAWLELLPSKGKAGLRFDRDTNNAAMKRSRRMTWDEISDQFLEKAVALTVGWHLIGPEGQALDIPFAPEQVRALYVSMPWVREAVTTFCDTLGNFARAAPTS